MPDERYDDSYRSMERSPRPPSPGLAAVLSVIIPGLGQLYVGRFLAALLWFVAGSLSWIILVGPLIHAASAYFAYQDARNFRGYD